MFNGLFALIPVIAWGTWLAPSQNVRFPNQQVKTFYVTAANLVITTIVMLFQGVDQLLVLPAASFGLIFLGGMIWTISGLFAFTATGQIGTARAFGIWAPINIVVSMVWGILLFGEFLDTDLQGVLLLIGALLIIIAGVLLIIFSKGTTAQHESDRQAARLGTVSAVATGVLWASYFIPIKIAGVSMWIGAFPMALGMFTASIVLVLLSGKTLRLERGRDVLRTLFSGSLWTAGNFGMLLLTDAFGTGRGFTISQLSVVVNALVGIFWLKEPEPKSKAAVLTFVGCVLATAGAIVLGNL
ncbi:MAG: GRP family sugar transporter [Anaerolineae bacterium]|nr:GRP family sugar transporter [Anaerolineae bacterium]